jgi:hypothetical protein
MYPDLTLPDVMASQFPVVGSLATTEETAGSAVGIGWLALRIRSRLDLRLGISRSCDAIGEASGLEGFDCGVK